MNIRKILKGIYALWYRDVKVFQREKSRVVSALALPLFWYFIFGGGMGSVAAVRGVDYRHFIFPERVRKLCGICNDRNRIIRLRAGTFDVSFL